MPFSGIVEAAASIMILGLVVQAIQIVYNYHGSLRSMKALSQKLDGDRPQSPRAVAIIPCKVGSSSEEEVVYTLTSISHLLSSGTIDRAVLVVEREDLGELVSRYSGYMERPGVEVIVSSEGVCRLCSGKNRALITALKRVEDLGGQLQAVILLDCDAYHHPRAVETALRGAVYEGAIVTGYRWYVLSDMYGVLYNTVSSIAFEYMGIERTRIVWGGLVAMPLEAVKGLNLAERFSEELSDDAVINIEARRRGYRVIFCPVCISATPSQRGLGLFISWAVRQMIILRLYTPRGFKLIFSIYLGNTAFIAASIAIVALNAWNTPGILFLSLLIGYIAVGALRAAISLKAYDPASIYGPETASGERGLWKAVYIVLTAVRAPLLLYILTKAWLAKNFKWRGSIYCIEGGRARPCQ